jgi:hypothetical protein
MARMPAGGRTGTIRVLAATVLLLMPLVVTFISTGSSSGSASRSGGYFDEARLWAGLAAAAVLLLAAVAVPRPLPRTLAGRLAVGGMWALAAWTAASIAWAPLGGPAFHDTQRLVLYALTLTAAAALLRPRALGRAVEPALAASCLVAIGYGLSGRLLPTLIHITPGRSAAGRLDQPLTYWNAVGAVAAIGLVLCARLAGDHTRRASLRSVAAAACAPLGMGLYLTYSRGALAAAATGLLVLVAIAPQRSQLRALAIAVAGAGLGAAAAAPFPVVASLGSGSRGGQGAAALALLAVVSLAAAVAQRRFALLEGAERLSVAPLRLRGLRVVAAVGACAVLALFVVATAGGERRGAGRTAATGATPTRLTSLQSHRYAYWNVALGAFADHPLNGLGSGGFAVRWLQKRKFSEAVLDAHSLYLETAAELGLPGLAALAALFAGLALAARRALRRDAALAAGLIAGVVAWASQSAVDWLWEMPAVTLIALVLAGALVAAAEATGQPDRPA